MTEQNIRMARYGRLLITRDRGARVRKKLNEILGSENTAVLDFSGVDLITPSFIDELVGEVVTRYGAGGFKQRIRFEGLSASSKHLVTFVLANRLKQHEDERRG